jgi:NMD protein affecting ribosome stability and mRNA decay
MSEIPIEVRVPLDTDGFLRRECPNCGRQFKYKHTESNLETPENTSVESYYCPYCYQSAPLNSWWTKEQLEYAQQLAFRELIEPELQNLQQQIRSLNRHGNFLQIDVSFSQPSEPNPLKETDDMIRVDFPCHPEEPLKIDEIWEQDVACFLCGIQYPLSLVEELPE